MLYYNKLNNLRRIDDFNIEIVYCKFKILFVNSKNNSNVNFSNIKLINDDNNNKQNIVEINEKNFNNVFKRYSIDDFVFNQKTKNIENNKNQN